MVAAVILLSPHRSRTQTTNRKHTGYQTWLQWPVNIHGKWIGIYIVPFNSIAALKALSTASPFHQVPYIHTVLLSSPKDFYLTLTHTHKTQEFSILLKDTATRGQEDQSTKLLTGEQPALPPEPPPSTAINYKLHHINISAFLQICMFLCWHRIFPPC